MGAGVLGEDVLVDLIVEETHTCYLGDRRHRHDGLWLWHVPRL